VLSRWNMKEQKPTVSRVQCGVRVSDDGTATLTSSGKGPTLWRAWGGPWQALHKDERHILADGDQVSLDCWDPEGSVFTCQLQGAMPTPQQAPPGYELGLPHGWSTGTDQATGATYYYNEQTGQSQWELPPLDRGRM